MELQDNSSSASTSHKVRCESKAVCATVSAQDLVGESLLDVRGDLHKGVPKAWAKEVIRLRGPYFDTSLIPYQGIEGQKEAIVRLADLFEPEWRLPMAAAFMTILPCRLRDPGLDEIMEALDLHSWIDQIDSLQLENSPAPDSLPGVQQFEFLVKNFSTYLKLHIAERSLAAVESELRSIRKGLRGLDLASDLSLLSCERLRWDAKARTAGVKLSSDVVYTEAAWRGLTLVDSSADTPMSRPRKKRWVCPLAVDYDFKEEILAFSAA